MTVGSTTVTRETPHCHSPYLKGVNMHHFLSDIRTDNSNQTAANVVRDKLVTAPESLKPNLPTNFNMKKLINDYRKKTRGCPASSATCAQDVVIPLSQRQDSQGGLFVLLLGDVSAP